MAKCARAECGKTVYPMEELKCLDQTWHKQCFRCHGCNMVLNLKNYKGYNKQPYCDAHYPKTTATVVADTPEMRRLAENTKIQSQVKYHEDFEKMKGKKLDVVDDPELQRVMKNSMLQSNVAYHGESERKEVMEKARPPLEETGQAQRGPAAPQEAPHAMAPPGAVPTPISATKAASALHQQQASSSPARGEHQAPPAGTKTTPYSAKQQQSPTLIYSSEQGGKVQPQGRNVGSIADYDPLNGQWGSIASAAAGRPNQPPPALGQKHSPTTSQHGPPGHSPSPFAQKHSPTSPGRTAGASVTTHKGSPGRGNTQPQQGIAYRAMYDYTAADNDEISFKEGDVIINCQPVDKGWMTGTVQRTGQWGMLPANYVERVH